MHNIFSRLFVEKRIFGKALVLSGLLAQVGHSTPLPATLLKEIGVMSEYKSSNPQLFTTLGASTEAMFFARTDAGNMALFRTDGTPGGTVRVKDFAWSETAQSALTGGMVSFGNGVVFTVAGANATWELWRSDGTAGGTARVKAVPAADRDGFFLGVPETLVASGGKVFLSADSTADGKELWATDGTEAGTALVKDIFPGMAQNGTSPNSSYPQGLCAFGGGVIFSADNGVNGLRVWKSDGTAGGTVPVKGTDGPTYPGQFTVSHGQVFFTGFGQSSFGEPPQFFTTKEVWRTDGTAEGTRMLMVFAEEDDVGGFVPVHGVTYFCRSHRLAATQGGFIQEIPGAFYQTDGTVAGTTQVLSFGTHNSTLSPQRILGVLSGGVVAYVARGDGRFSTPVPRLASLAGNEVNQLAAGDVGSSVTVGGALYVMVKARYYPEYLYRYFPTDAPDNRFRPLGVMNGPMLNTAGGKLFANWNGPLSAPVGQEPWHLDAITGLPTLLGDLYPGSTEHRTIDGPWTNLATPLPHPVNLNGTLLFLAQGETGMEWWKSDGTTSGTTVLKDIVPGPGGHQFNGWPAEAPHIQEPISSGGMVFFKRELPHPAYGNELWATDGTEGGTQLVYDADSAGMGLLKPMAQGVFWVDPAARTLWTSDGTPGGTRAVKSTGREDSAQQSAVVGGHTYTVLEQFDFQLLLNREWLWEVHPSPDRTRALFEFTQPGADASLWVNKMVAWRGAAWIFLTRTTKLAPQAPRTEIWRLVAGETTPQHITTLPSSGQYNPGVTEALTGDNVLYFDYNSGELDPVSGQVITRLWVTDGTAAGTRQVAPLLDIKLANYSGLGSFVRVAGDRLFTLYNGDAAGPEVWTTDGTAAGTRRLTGENPPHEFLPNGSLPANLTVGGDGWLYYDRETVENALRVRRIYRVNATNPQAEEAFGDLPENQVNVFGGASLPRAMFWAHGRLYASCYTSESTHEFYWWPAPAAATPYSTWASAQNLHLGQADPLADPDTDGSANVLEFVSATSPLHGSSQPGLSIAPGASGPEAQFRLQSGTGLSLVIETSTDCATWKTDLRIAANGIASELQNALVHIRARTGSAVETITLQLSSPSTGAPPLYVRLRVE